MINSIQYFFLLILILSNKLNFWKQNIKKNFSIKTWYIKHIVKFIFYWTLQKNKPSYLLEHEKKTKSCCWIVIAFVIVVVIATLIGIFVGKLKHDYAWTCITLQKGCISQRRCQSICQLQKMKKWQMTYGSRRILILEVIFQTVILISVIQIVIMIAHGQHLFIGMEEDIM